MPVQHLVGVQGRAHRLADLPEGLELLHLGGQLRSPGLQRTHQLDLAERDRRLRREVVQHPHLVVAERRDRVAPHREDAHHLVAQHHRRREERAVPGESLEVLPAVLGITPARPRSAGSACRPPPGRQARPAALDGVVRDLPAVRPRESPRSSGRAGRHLASAQEELRGVGAAQAGGAIDDLVEDLRRVGGRSRRAPAGSPRWRPPARGRRSAPGRGLSLPLRPPGSAWSLRPSLPPARLSSWTRCREETRAGRASPPGNGG